MVTRRHVTLAFLGGVAGLVLATRPSTAQIAFSESEALEALDPWADALFSGDPAQVEKVLAPEYQILRSDGSGYDKASYLRALPVQKIRSKFRDIVATRGPETLVIRYNIETDQEIGGKKVVGISPRLSVFRKEAGQWLLVSHANFAPLG